MKEFEILMTSDECLQFPLGSEFRPTGREKFGSPAKKVKSTIKKPQQSRKRT